MVFENRNHCRRHHLLWNMENVLITPHIAGPSFGGNAEVQDMIWNICMENMERYLNGKN